ncbi:MAG: hypothetical protein ACREBD_10460 [Blastocatellia bacterium]
MKIKLFLVTSLLALTLAITLASAASASAQNRPVPDRKPRESQPVARPTPDRKPITREPKDSVSDYLDRLLKLIWRG